MPSYNYLVERLYELTQIVVALAFLGILCCIALWYIWGKYSEMEAFIRDDGLSGKLTVYRLAQKRASRVKRGECPSHGTPLRIYGGKCPISGCAEGKEEE